MFSEILKIIPKITDGDARNMENTLNKRFSNIAKKFGSGLVSAIKGGGLSALAIGLIDKVLNPMQAVQESIEKALHAGDDLSTFAKHFNTTEGNLARLQAFGQAKGLDAEGTRMLLEKFQSAIAQTALNPEQPSSVRNYVGRKDTAEAFFEFLQNRQKLNPVQQNLVDLNVFGERQILKSASFLGANFKELDQLFNAAGVPGTQKVTSAAQLLGKRSENLETLSAVRSQKDLVTKASLINDNTIAGLDRKDNLDLRQENKTLGKFDSLETISIENQKLINLAVNKFLLLAPLLADLLPKITAMIGGGVAAVQDSRALRGILPGQGKEK